MTVNGTLDDQRLVDQRIAEQPLTFEDSARHPLSGKAVPIGAIRAMKGMAGMEGMGIMRVNVSQHNNDSKPDNSRSNSLGENDINGSSVTETSPLEAPDASKPSSEFSAPSRITRRGPGRPRKSPVTVHHTHLHRLAPKQARPAEYISNHDDVSPPEANRPQMQYRLSRPFEGDKAPDNGEANTHMDRKESASDSNLKSPHSNLASPKAKLSPASRRHSTEVPTQTAPSVGSQNTSSVNSPRGTSHSQTPIEFQQQSPYMPQPGLAFSPAQYPPMGLNAPQPNGLPQFAPHAPPAVMGMPGYPMFMGGMQMGGAPIGYPSPISAMPMMNSYDQSRIHPNGDPRGIPMGTGLPPPPIVPPSSIPNSLLGNSGRISPPLQRKKSQSQRAPPSNRRRTYGTGGDGFDVFRYSMTPGTHTTPSVAPITPSVEPITPSPAPITPSSEPITPSAAPITPGKESEQQTPSPKRNSSESAKEKPHEDSDKSPKEQSDKSPVEQKKTVENPQVARGMSVNELMRMANSVAKEVYSAAHGEALDSLKKKHDIETDALVKQQKKQQNRRYDINVDLSRREALRGVQLSEHGSQRQQLKKQQAKELKKLTDKHASEISSEQRERFVQMRDSLKELEAADQSRRRRRKNGKATDTELSDPENNNSGESDEFSTGNDARDLDTKKNHRPLNKHFVITEKNDNKVAFRTSDCQLEWFQGIEEVMYEETIEKAKLRLPSESLSFLKDTELPIPKQADLAMASLFQHQDADIRQRIAEANSMPRSPKPSLRPPLTGDITNPNTKLIYTVAERGRVQSVVTPAPVTPDVPLRRVSSQKPQKNENSSPRPIKSGQVFNGRNNSHASPDQMSYPNFPFAPPHNNGIAQTVDPHHYFQMMQNGSFTHIPYAGTPVPYGAVPSPLMIPPNAPNGMPAPISQPMVGSYPPIMPGVGFPMPPNSPGQLPLATPPIPPGVQQPQQTTEQALEQPVQQPAEQPAEQLAAQPVQQPVQQHINAPSTDITRTEAETKQTGIVNQDSNEKSTEVDGATHEAPELSSDNSPPMFQMSTNGTKRSSSSINDNENETPRPSKVHITPDRIPQVVMPLSQSSQDSLSTDAEDSVNEDFEDSSAVKTPTRNIIEKPMKGRRPKGDPNDPNSLENIPRSERYWLDQQNQFMIDLNNLGFEAISKSSTHHECSLCKKIFHSRLLCIRHAAEHLSRKAFWCIECGLEFTRCDTLQRHFKGRCEKRNQRTQKAELSKPSIESSSPKVVSGGMRIVRPSPSLQLSNSSSSNGAEGTSGRIPLPMEPLQKTLSDSDTVEDSQKPNGIRAKTTSDDETNNNVNKAPHLNVSAKSAEARTDTEKSSDEQSEGSKHKPPAYSKSSGKTAHEESRPRIPGPVLPPSLASM